MTADISAETKIASVQSRKVPVYHAELIQAALSSNSPLIGQLAYEADFEQYNVSLIAVNRSGERLTNLTDVRLQMGDGLLLEGSRDFVKNWASDEGFVMLSLVENSSPTKWNRSLLALFLILALIVATVRVAMYAKAFRYHNAGTCYLHIKLDIDMK